MVVPLCCIITHLPSSSLNCFFLFMQIKKDRERERERLREREIERERERERGRGGIKECLGNL